MFAWPLSAGQFAAVHVLSMALLLLSGCSSQPSASSSPDPPVPTRPARPPATLSPDEARIFKVNRDEELVLQLTPLLRSLEKWLSRENSEPIADLFTGTFEYTGPAEFDLQHAGPGEDTGLAAIKSLNWPIAEKAELLDNVEAVWKPLRQQIQFQDPRYGVTSGRLDASADVFLMELTFESRGTDQQQRQLGLKSKLQLDWHWDESGEWRIGRWHQMFVDLIVSKQTLFQDTTSKSIRDSETLSRLQSSSHEQLLLNRAADRSVLAGYNPVFQCFTDWNSLFQYTSASVVDLDQDGWDDLFVTDRTGRATMLRNCGDSTFEDISAECGLAIEQVMANCALFADFDNDGDPDLLLGRSLKPTQFYRNEDGRMKLDIETSHRLFMTRFVTSGSVIDVNRDGLLDVYLSTYATRSGTDLRWIEFAVPPHQQSTMFQKLAASHSFVDRRGPPNVLLMNTGGNLRPVAIEENLEQWRNSFQSVWVDYDQDGDADVYLCNDFAPDVLLRNDTERGSFEIRFAEVTGQIFSGNTMGFGMGASVGDYDSDGLLDLYVSNMYSKAGHRVIDHLDGEVDPRIEISAKGNFLYRNVGGKFEHVAGLEKGKLQVSRVGWSFGGQFADFNNDGNLDIYVPSGFFTAPDSIAEETDL